MQVITMADHVSSEIPTNSIGFSTPSDTPRSVLLVRAFRSLVGVWGDAQSMRLCSYDQHFYITKALLVCLKHMPESTRTACSDSLLQGIISGVQHHIANAIPQLRLIGFAAAEVATRLLSSAHVLKFDYTQTADTQLLYDIASQPVPDLLRGSLHDGSGTVPQTDTAPPPCTDNLVTQLNNTAIEKGKLSNTAIEKGKLSNTAIEKRRDDPDEVLQFGPGTDATVDSDDDDDDLKPYAMDNDTADPSKPGPPVFIRDCITGLQVNNNAALFEVSFRACEGLIRKNPPDFPEVCIELVNLLLHMSDDYALPDFITFRTRALVAATVSCPALVGSFLGREFYASNYSLGHRVLMLQILADASQEMSQVRAPSLAQLSGRKPADDMKNLSPDGSLLMCVRTPQAEGLARRQAAQATIDRRLEANTRRFCTLPPTLVTKENRFSTFVGHFFYPLLVYFGRSNPTLTTFDLMAADSFVLGRLIQTLGIILHRYILVIRNM